MPLERQVKIYFGPPGRCLCGCGKRTTRVTKNRFPYRKGDYRAFVTGHNLSWITKHFPEEQRRKARLNTGDKLRGTGEGKGYIKYHKRHLHRVLAEEKLGRKLKAGEIVHHKNRNKRDNRKQNLGVLPSQAMHARLHDSLNRWKRENRV